MKFRHTLDINSKEIEVFCRALTMYKGHLDNQMESGLFTNISPEGFPGYRNKVINMLKVMEEIRSMPKLEASEKGKIPESIKEKENK